MRFSTTILVGALCVALVRSLPVPDDNGFNAEALDRRMMAGSDSVTNLRSKRTIGILRVLFPDISKMIEDKVNMIVSEVIKALGPVVLRNVLGGGRGGGGGGAFGGGAFGGGAARNNNGGGGTTVTVASNFDDDDAADDDDDDSRVSSMSANGSKVSISLPTFPPDEDEDSEGFDSAPVTSSTSTAATDEEAFPTTTSSIATTEATSVANSVY